MEELASFGEEEPSIAPVIKTTFFKSNCNLQNFIESTCNFGHKQHQHNGNDYG